MQAPLAQGYQAILGLQLTRSSPAIDASAVRDPKPCFMAHSSVSMFPHLSSAHILCASDDNHSLSQGLNNCTGNGTFPVEFGPPRPTLTSSNQVQLDHHPTPPPSSTIVLIVLGLELTRSNRLCRRVSSPEFTQYMNSSVCRCSAVAIDYLWRAGFFRATLCLLSSGCDCSCGSG